MQSNSPISFRVPLAASLAALAGLPAVGLAQLDAGDVGLAIDNGKIVTGLIAEEEGGDGGDTIPDRRRVFIGEVGVFEDEGDDIVFSPRPGNDAGAPSTNTPGFDSNPGTFAVGQSLGLDILSNDLIDSPVVRYDVGSDSLVSTTVDVQASFTSARITRTTGNTPQDTTEGPSGVILLPVFDEDEGDGSGRWHRHYNFSLFDGIDGTSGDLIAAGDGVYVLEADIDYTGTEFADTDPFFFVFGVGRPDLEVQAAVDFLNANVVPEPTGLAAIALGSLTLLRRRRR